MPQQKATGSRTIADRGVAYGIPGVLVDGMDVLNVRRAARDAVERGRRGEGPSLLECRTYRFKGHGVYDTGLAYRTKDEVSEWAVKDPITRLGKMLIEDGILKPGDIDSMDKEAISISEDAVEYAKNSPYPTVDEMQSYTYVK
jgi:TPP-dependent pyruvate/acetoin dehydrogenase alpha subunit